MTDYGFPDPDAMPMVSANLLVIGDGFTHLPRRFCVQKGGDAAADIASAPPMHWAAVLIEAGAITPAIARALSASPAERPVIVAAGADDADQVGALLGCELTIIDQPVDARRLEQVLNDVAPSGGVADAGSLTADERIMALQRDAQRMATAISELAQLRPPEAQRPVTASRIRSYLRARRLRDRFFNPELFADPAWDMLLDLGASRLEGRKVSVSSLCIAAAVPTTTALRWVKALVDRGIFERENDPDDARRAFINLTPTAAQALDACLDAVLNQPGQ